MSPPFKKGHLKILQLPISGTQFLNPAQDPDGRLGKMREQNPRVTSLKSMISLTSFHSGIYPKSIAILWTE